MSNKTLTNLLEGKTKHFPVGKTRTLKVRTLKPEEMRSILLDRNNKGVKNHKVSLQAVKKYAQDMANDKWSYTGDPIAFTTTGDLIQGQHRLYAAIKANKSLTAAIATGLDKQAYEVLDQGKTRTIGDVFYSAGQPSDVATITRLIWAWKNNRIQSIDKFSGEIYTSSIALKTLKEHPEAVDFTKRYKDCKIISKHVAGFLYWLFSMYDESTAEEFLDRALMGINLQRDTPDWSLNQKLIRNSQKLMGKMNRTQIIASVILAWRRYINLDKSKNNSFTWNPTKQFPDPFPVGFGD